MKYYTIKEFAAYLYVNPVTLYKKEDLPNYDAHEMEGTGAPRQLWMESTVNMYKKMLTLRIENALSDKQRTFPAIVKSCRMGIEQAVRLLENAPAKKVRLNSSKNNFEITINQLAKIGIKNVN